IKVENLEDAKRAGNSFNDRGVKYAIITLGAKGAAVIERDRAEIVSAFKVDAIDTTAAGDSFIGGLSSKLNIEKLTYENILKAVEFGNKVSSITVQRKGAQPSIATLEEVIQLYGEGN
ncbi:MAG: PfkB family carbohydrate kinase, partial [Clostridium sp.]